MKKQKLIFSGDYSRYMWSKIDHAKTVAELKDALYCVCCRIQELETVIERMREKK